MRLFITTIIALLGLAEYGFATVNFNGTWVLDLKASDSPEAMMKRMGVSGPERKLAALTKLESTYSQSGNLLTITTRGPRIFADRAPPFGWSSRDKDGEAYQTLHDSNFMVTPW